MKNNLFALSLGIFGLVWFAQNSHAQGASCAKREVVVERLASKYGESRKNIGMGNNNSVVETYASTETGTWTILVTLPNGMSCLIASGQSWERVEEEVSPAGQKT